MKKRFLSVIVIVGLLVPNVFAQEVSVDPVVPEESIPVESAVDQSRLPLRITEIMIGSEVNPDKEAWIEIHNPNEAEVLLDNWKISGITSSGRFVKLSNEDGVIIPPNGFYLISRYSNSSSSALTIKPQSVRSSIVIPNPDVHIELKNPNDEIIDTVSLIHQPSEVFSAYERTETDEWIPSTSQINLKPDLTNTFGSPGAFPIEEEIIETKEGATTSSRLSEESVPAGEGEDIYPRLPEVSPDPKSVILNEMLPDPKTAKTQNEFIELFNPTDAAIDLSGYILDTHNRDNDIEYKFENPDLDYVLEPQEYLTLFRPETGLALDNYTDTVYLIDPNGIIVDEFTYESVTIQKSWGRNPGSTDEWIELVRPTPDESNAFQNQPPIVVIREQGGTNHMKINLTGEDSIDPDGDSLTYEWTFEEGVKSDRKNPPTHEYGAPGVKNITLTVTDEFGMSSRAEWVFEAIPKGGNQNNASTEGADYNPRLEKDYPAHQIITEIMPSPEGKDEEGEWVELYNSTDHTIDLGGWYLDDDEGKSSPYQFEPGTHLVPLSYLVVRAPELKLSFKNSDDVVRLLDPNKNPKQVIQYSGAIENWSYALRPNSDQFDWTPKFTPGVPNRFPPPPKAYPKESVTIYKILPNPNGEDKGKEAIVLKNHLNESIDLSYWGLKNKNDKIAVLNEWSIEAHEQKSFLLDSIGLGLVNKSDHITLIDPVKNEIDSIQWYGAPNGQYLYKPGTFKDGMEMKVVRVVDGDTMVMEWEDQPITVRLIGVDTPETVHPKKPVQKFGENASAYTKQLLGGKTVRLDFDQTKTDRYNRLLAYVYLDDLLVNAHLIEEGYGYAYTRFPFKFKNEFVQKELTAKRAQKGLWQIPLIVKEIEEQKAVIDEEPDKEIETDEEVLVFEDPDKLLKKIQKEQKAEVKKCAETGLLIHSILPSSQKGITDEFIRVINPTDQTICLAGWQLDDELNTGSRPFVIQGGGIEPGAIRTFYRSETKLALNNSFDCATLMGAGGHVVDQLCYQKTRTNEIWTHEGGECIAPLCQIKKSSKKSSKSKASQKTKWQGSPVEYRIELSDSAVAGTIKSIDPLTHSIQLALPDQSIKTILYHQDQIDPTELERLIKIPETITMNVRNNQLVTLQLPPLHSAPSKTTWPIEFNYMIGLLAIGLGGKKIKVNL